MNYLLHQELQQDWGYDPPSSQKLLHWWYQSAPSLNVFDTEWTLAPSLELFTLHSNHVVNLTDIILRKKKLAQWIGTTLRQSWFYLYGLPNERWISVHTDCYNLSKTRHKNHVEVQIFPAVVCTEISATSNNNNNKNLFFSLNKSEEHIVHSPQFIWNRRKSQNNPTTDFVLQIHLTEAIHIKTD